MDRQKNLWKSKWVFLITLSVAVLGCKEKFPYQDTFKNRIIENAGVEPIIESLTIDARLDSSTLKDYYLRELTQNKQLDKESAKNEYEKAQQKYNQSLKYDGQRMADVVYLKRLTDSKNTYYELISGFNDSSRYDFYYQRLKSPTVFEEVTVKFRLSKDEPLLVNRYRIDIFQGDTSFYELKAGRNISDYIK
jgi:hypothetical protein